MSHLFKQAFILEDNIDAQRYIYEITQTSFPGIKISIAASLQEAYSLLTQCLPDIALIDLNLPDGSGIDILQHLSIHNPSCISIVTTIYDDDSHLFSALRAGASGYLLKEQRKQLLIQALQGITEGKPALTPKIAMKILHHFSQSCEPQPATENETPLSKREIEVLKLLAMGHSVKAVASQLYITHNTVASHIKNIYSKLNITSRAEAAKKAVQMGLTE